jgi:hypothetical protein
MTFLVQSGDVIRITDKMTLFANAQNNVYHVTYSGPTFVDSDTLLADIKTWMEAIHGDLAATQVSQLTYDSVDAYNLTQDAPMGELPMTTTTEGEVTGDSLPMQTAAVIRFTTGVARSQGRKFFGGFAEGAQADGGILQAGPLATLAIVAALILDGFSSGSGDCVPGNYSTALTRFAPYAAALINTVMGTQRRRRYGIGT